ncbi:MAG: filamentous hemagglutinin N-terminal domain-containing protein [Alphaproteobacteria bacterium]|nr:filamentous hemagglutinin N-terminal domain-containing protein [Alphaproteobacteria bacterium]
MSRRRETRRMRNASGPASMARRWLPRACLFASTALVGLSAIGPALANPQGGQVVAGQAQIVTTAPNRLDINQSSERAVIDWQRFSIAPGETTAFNQPGPGSITFNRVVTGDPSTIAGRLIANGQIVLINPSGVTFAQGAQVNVNSLIATTANISNSNAMAGRLVFDQASDRAGARIVNEGEITVREGGIAALVGPEVANHGVIQGRLARVVLGGAETFAIDLAGDGLLAFELRDPVRSQPRDGAGNARPVVENTGTINADGGAVMLSARTAAGIVGDVVNVGGVVSARAVRNEGGVVVFGTEGDGGVSVSGTVDVSGLGAGQRGGNVTVTGAEVRVASTARIDARGAAGGGRVLVGGNLRGQGPERNARRTRVDRGATLDASATENGDGGRIIIWSDEETVYAGSLLARGGASGGDGGFAEVSSHNLLAFDGTVDLRAPQGATGTLLLDPRNITIQNGGSESVTVPNSGDPRTITGTDDDSILRVATLEAALAAANIIIDTSGGSAGVAGNVAFSDNVDYSGTTNSLTVRAAGAVAINADIIAGANNLTIEGLTAGTAAGGAITQAGGAPILSTGIITLRGQSITLDAQVGGTGPGAGQATQLVAVAANGAISQTGGSIRAASVTANATGGAVTLEQAANAIGSISGTGDGFSVRSAQALSLTALSITSTDAVSLVATGAASDITLNGAIDAAGQGVTLNAGRNLIQALGIITADSLSATAAAGTVSLPLANSVAQLSGTAANGFLFNSAAPLLTTGPISNTVAGGITLNAPGGANSISLEGALTASGQLVQLLAGGSINQTAAGVITGSELAANAGNSVNLGTADNLVPLVRGSASTGAFRYATSGSLTINAPSISAGTEVDLATTGAASVLTINDTIFAGDSIQVTTNNLVFGGGGFLDASGGTVVFGTATRDVPIVIGGIGVVPGSLTIESGLLSFTNAGSVGASNFTRSGGAGAADITIRDFLLAPGQSLILDASGNILQEPGTTLAVSRLAAVAAGAVTLGTGGASFNVPTLAGGSSGNFSVVSTDTITIDRVAGPAGLLGNIDGITSPGAIVQITAPNGIFQGPFGPITANAFFPVAANGDVDLANAVGGNSVSLLSGTAFGTFRFVNGNTTLTLNTGFVTDGVQAGGPVRLGTSGTADLVLTRGITAPFQPVLLTAGGSITQGLPITAGAVEAIAGGAVTLTNLANSFTQFLGSAVTGIDVVSGQTLSAGPVSNSTSGGISLSAPVAGSTLSLDGAITAPGQTVDLDAFGGISQAGTGVITAANLIANTGGPVSLDFAANAVGSVTGSSAAAFRLTNGASSLTVGAAGISAGADVIDLRANGAGSDLTINGPLGTAAFDQINLFAGRDIIQTGGTITTGFLVLNAGGAAQVAQAGNNFNSLDSTTVAGLVVQAASTINLGNITNSGAGGVSITATGAASDLILGGAIAAPGQAVALEAGSDIQQFFGAITAASLSAEAIAGFVSLNSFNAVGAVSGSAALGFNATTNQTTSVGPITNSISGGISLSALGAGNDLLVAGNLSAPGQTISLNGGRDILPAGGEITANRLNLSAASQIGLTGPLQVAQLQASAGGDLSFIGANDLTIVGTGISTPGAVQLSVASAGALLGSTAPITGATVELVADRIGLGSTVGTAGTTSALVIRPLTAGRAIIAGGTPTGGEEAANLALSGTEMGFLRAGAVRLGQAAGPAAAAIELRGMTLDPAITRLVLESSDAITQTAGAIASTGSLTLGVDAAGDVLIGQAGNNISGIVGTVGDALVLTSANTVTIGSLAAVGTLIAAQAGLSVGSDASITGGAITVNNPVTLPGALELTATAGSIFAGAALSAASLDAEALVGNVFLSSGANVLPIVTARAGSGFVYRGAGSVEVGAAGVDGGTGGVDFLLFTPGASITVNGPVRAAAGTIFLETVGGGLANPGGAVAINAPVLGVGSIFAQGEEIQIGAQLGGSGAGLGQASFVRLQADGAAGDIAQNAAGVIRTARLEARAPNAGVTLFADNVVAEASGVAQSDYLLRSTTSLRVGPAGIAAGDETTLQVAAAGGTLTVDGTVTGPNGIVLQADSMAINQNVGAAGLGFIDISPFSPGRSITAGGVPTAIQEANTLAIGNAEFARLLAPVIGLTTSGGGSIAVSDITLGAGRTLALGADGAVTQTGGVVRVENLAIVGGPSVDLPGQNEITTVAASSGGDLRINVAPGFALTAGTIVLPAAFGGNLTGITAPGAITLGAGADLFLSSPVNIGANTLRLFTATGTITQDPAAPITAGQAIFSAPGGTVTLTAPGNSIGTVAGGAGAGFTLALAGPGTVGAVAGDGVVFPGTVNGITTTGGPVSILANGTLTLDRVINSGGFNTYLRTSAGDILSTATGGIVGNQTILAADAGAVDLAPGSSNVIDVAGFAGNGGFSFRDTNSFWVWSITGDAQVASRDGITTAGGPVSLTSGGGTMLLAFPINAPGEVVRLRSTGADIQQFGGGTITADAILARADVGQVLLNGVPNVAADIAGFGATGFTYRGAGAVGIADLSGAGDAFVAGAAGIGSGAGTISVLAQSGLAIDAPLATSGTALLRTIAGDITGGTAGATSVGGLLLRADAGAIDFGATDIPHAIGNLAARAAGTISLRSANAITVGDLSGAGDAQVAGAAGLRTANAGDAATNQDITIATGAGAITLNAGLDAGTGVVRLGSTSGTIGQSAAGIITAGSLLLRSGAAGAGAIALDIGPNAAGTLAGAATGGIAYRSGGAFSVGSVAGDGSVAGATGLAAAAGEIALISAGTMTLAEAVNAGTLAVRLRTTTGDVTQTAGGIVTASQLDARADAGQVDLGTATNAVGNVAGVAASGFRLRAAGALTVNGTGPGGNFPAVSGIATTDAPITLAAGGAILLDAPLAAGAGTIRLRASTGTITQTPNGDITAGTLAAFADAGQVDLANGGGTNAVGSIAGLGASGFRYSAAGAVSVGSVAADGTLTAAQDGIASTNAPITLRSAGTLTLDEVVDAGTGTVRLRATAGDITQSADGGVRGASALFLADAGQVSLTAAGGAAVAAGERNLAGTIAGTGLNGFAFRSDGPVTIGTVTGDGALVGTRVGLVTAGAPIAVMANGTLTIGDVLTATGGIIRLRAETGAITQTAGGALTAGSALLRADAGPVTLSGAPNDVNIIAGAAVGGFTFADSNGLTVGAVAGLGPIAGANGVASASPVTLLANGPLTLTQPVVAGTGADPSDIVRLRATTGDITQTATGQVVANALLALADTGRIDLGLPGAPNDVRNLALQSPGQIIFRGIGQTAINSIAGDALVPGVTGVATVGGQPITLVSGGLDLEQPVNAGTGIVALEATAGSITQGAGGIITGSQVLARASNGSILLGQPNDTNEFAAFAADDVLFSDADGLTIGGTVTDPAGLVASASGVRAGDTAQIEAGLLLPPDSPGPDNTLLIQGAGIDAQGLNQTDGYGRILVRMSGGGILRLTGTPGTNAQRIWAADSSGGTFTAADLDPATGSPPRLQQAPTLPLIPGTNDGSDIILGALSLVNTDLYLFGLNTSISGGPIFVRSLGVYSPNSSVILSGAIFGDTSGNAATFVTRGGSPTSDQRFNDCPIGAASCFILPPVGVTVRADFDEFVVVIDRPAIDEQTLTIVNAPSEDLLSRERQNDRRRDDEEENGSNAAGGAAQGGAAQGGAAQGGAAQGGAGRTQPAPSR